MGDLFGVQSLLLTFVIRMGSAFLILFAGRWLAGRTRDWGHALLVKTGLTQSLQEVATKFLYYSIWGASLLIALTVIGVPTASLVAFIGIALVILGIALQESIGNFAATIIFLLFEPFQVGDFIETGGVAGTVQEIQVFNTVLHKLDRTVAILPNGKIQSDGLLNYSKLPEIRVDLQVGISYATDIPHARQVILDVLRQDPRVLDSPAPEIVVLGFGDSSVNLGIRPYARGHDYWPLLWDLPEAVKNGFDAAGIVIPFPQRDLHLITSPGLPIESS